jgi:EAL domain-containing protein (putative c-di-GMP-specific phosphodiesterase class I)
MRRFVTSTLGHRSVARRETVRALGGLATALHPRRIQLLRRVRVALESEELFLVYQPKQDLLSGRIVGAEALLRWRHPERGVVPPGAFLPAIAGSAVMADITRWALDRALAAHRSWGVAGRGVTVEVNLAGRDLLDPGFCEAVGRLLEDRGASPGTLGLEITENDLLEDPERASTTVIALGEKGVTVALDDFGTGYSSLTRLRELPIDEVKIDRSFVAHMLEQRSARSIVRATIDLTHDLGRTVVAEGVESEAVRDDLVTLGCDLLQGFWLARPMPSDEMAGWLAARDVVEPAAA